MPYISNSLILLSLDTSKAKKQISGRGLIEMLDLEERKILANDLHLSPPNKLNDKSFSEAVSKKSNTTILSYIIQSRYPIILMLHEIYTFIEHTKQISKARTTTRIIILPTLRGKEIRCDFKPAWQRAIATLLNDKYFLNSISKIKHEVEDLNKTLYQLQIFKGRTEYQLTAKGIQAYKDQYRDPDIAFYLQNKELGLQREYYVMKRVYNRVDFEFLKRLCVELRRIIMKLESLINNHDKSTPIHIIDAKSLFDQFTKGLHVIDNKVQVMPGQIGKGGPSQPNVGLLQVQEKLKKIEENIFAASDFEETGNDIFDFLTWDIWNERDRVYELWMLIHLLKLGEDFGFMLDIKRVKSDGTWNLKFTKDKEKVATLRSSTNKSILEVYYQYIDKEGKGGNMPDIAIKKNRRYLAVLDPKYGKTYNRRKLVDLVARYNDAYSADLTMIHNFYKVNDYDYDVIPIKYSKKSRCIIASDIRLGSHNLGRLEKDISSTIVKDSKITQETYVILIDVSASMQNYSKQTCQIIDKLILQYNLGDSEKSFLILFDSKIVKEISTKNISDISNVLSGFSGGGTNITAALRMTMEKIVNSNSPVSLFVITDGQDSGIDTNFLTQGLLSINLKLFAIFEISNYTSTVSPLEKIAQAVTGRYHKLRASE